MHHKSYNFSSDFHTLPLRSTHNQLVTEMDAGGATPASATAAASSPAKIDADRNGTAAFAPSVWGDFFATYVPPPTQAWQWRHSLLCLNLLLGLGFNLRFCAGIWTCIYAGVRGVDEREGGGAEEASVQDVRGR
jgi:hypothetical protein